MEIRYGSNYKDKKGNIYRLVGDSKPMGRGDKLLLSGLYESQQAQMDRH